MNYLLDREKKFLSKRNEFIFNLAIGSLLLAVIGIAAYISGFQTFSIFVFISLTATLFVIPLVVIGQNEEINDWLYAGIFLFDIYNCSMLIRYTDYHVASVSSLMGLTPLFTFALVRTSKKHILTFGISSLGASFILGTQLVTLIFIAITLFSMRTCYLIYLQNLKILLKEKEATEIHTAIYHQEEVFKDVLTPLKMCQGDLKLLDDLLDETINRTSLRSKIFSIHEKIEEIEQNVQRKKTSLKN
ncbi:MAG: hypothetical protein H6622_11630 [Halobacteriovoraceae bacterium]|nr:hypothetical protein [Halobacteriovoraceae bacterium]